VDENPSGASGVGHQGIRTEMTQRISRARLLGFGSAIALACVTTPAFAQTVPQDEETSVDEIIVTGTRVAGRTRLDTIAPVDVISGEALSRQGSTELAQALSTLAPSISFSRPSITDGTDSVRPATLRGLAPDQTLVLLNGIRRHSSALVNVNGSIGRGSAAVDLNAIPSIAIDRVEVLREGASAQYGSDAIAGVINLRLREARSGGGLTATYGLNSTEFATARIPQGRREDDGETFTIAGWQGLPLGEEGFLTVSAEYRDREPTSRGDLDPRLAPRPARVTSRFGDPKTTDATIYLNAGVPLSNGFELYGFTGYQRREAESAATPRTFNNANNDPAVFPDGFLPIIAPTVDDFTAAGGLRGKVGGFDVDLNLVYGRNEIAFRVEDTLNGSLVPNSPTSFDAGGLAYDQFVLGLDVVRRYDVGLFQPLNVAFGAEARRETYQIFAGELASFQFRPGRVPFPGAVGAIGAGSQGFIGFRPSNEVDVDRNSYGLYLDLDAQVTEQFNVNGAVRFEDFSDFGNTTTGKIAARYDFTDSFALRGAASTGFRAPGLQQAFFTATAINFVIIGGVSTPVEVTTFPASDPIARNLGARPLEAEESTNYSFGLVFNKGPFELTVDAYQIDITDRIVLSENLLGSATGNATSLAIFNLLNPPGTGGSVGGGRFFVNGVDTTTEGVDIVGRYRHDYSDTGRVDFTLAANLNTTDVTRVPAIPTGVPIPAPPSLFNRINVLTFEEGTPSEKIVFGADLSDGPVGLSAKVQSFSSVLQPFSNTDPAFDVNTGDKVLLDLEARYRYNERVELALGVNNVTDVFPDFTPATVNTTGATAFSNFSPFGISGRFIYGRLSLNW